MATPIGTLGTIPTITIAGRVFTDLTTLIAVNADITASAAQRWSTFRRSSAGYQVTTGKTYKVHAMTALAIGASEQLTLGYGDTDVGKNSSSAPTNPVYLYGATFGLISPGRNDVGAGTQGIALDGAVGFAALKYPVVLNTGSTTVSNACVWVYGYET